MACTIKLWSKLILCPNKIVSSQANEYVINAFENKRDYLIVPDSYSIFEKLLLLAPNDDFLMFIKENDKEPIRNIYIV